MKSSSNEILMSRNSQMHTYYFEFNFEFSFIIFKIHKAQQKGQKIKTFWNIFQLKLIIKIAKKKRYKMNQF